MASGGPVEELCEEASCSICLDFFRDPVTIPECGHSFCRACLGRAWGEPGVQAASCPQCRGRAQEGNLRPNLQLANMVGLIQKLRPVEEKGGVCEKHREPLKFFCRDDGAPLCVVCVASREHEGHEVAPLEAASQENRAFVAAPKGRICQKHQEPMKLFCKDDKALLCVVCDRSKEHRGHETLPLDEASQEYKDQFCNSLKILKKEREKILAFKGDVEKASQDLLEQTEREKQGTADKFRQLRLFLEEKEKLLLVQMEELEKEVSKKRDQHLAELSESLSALESLIQDMEEKSQQSPSELLQDVRSTLQRYEENKTFVNPVMFPLALKWKIWDCCDISPFLEGVMKQLKGTLDSGLSPQKGAKVILDPDTAHTTLVLSEGQKSVREGKAHQDLPDNPERFYNYAVVLGREGFRAGRQFWEVLVGSEGDWAVGVARKSVKRKGDITFCPEEGIWAVEKWGDCYKAYVKGHLSPLTLRGELKRVRVCLNYAGGRVAFFDADKGELLYEFSGASFSGETLLPFFWVQSKGYLKISS
ncbi:E3 ubiquitin-protein ligase TRIM7-like [Paroedura picta]|uniref:E3 ubiquitin-protein ligase TRIM7-like n=1 Tax=Paroedura picta TaxID=143630 RepID=UPI00405690AA